MADRQKMKRAVSAVIDGCRTQIIGWGEDILRHPELGFKETRTAQVVASILADMGVPARTGLAITGVKGTLSTGADGPTVAVLGELDSVLAPDHPFADPLTGAAHACGHHMQLAVMLGAGLGLAHSGVLGEITGRVVLFAVPAEEYVEVEYRMGLAEQGKLGFLSGKTELVRLGEFDDIDMAIMVHSTSDPGDGMARIAGSSNGLVGKRVQFIGRAAHAGAAPWDGVNALNAATLAQVAIALQRETFRDEDTVRVHPIVTKGGTLVNVVPDDVRLETYVRGRTVESIRDGSAKVDRALRAGAVGMGARVRISTIPGYLPLRNDPTLASLFRANLEPFIPPGTFFAGGHFGGSTDMGDITHIMPAIHPMIGGATGTLHGSDFSITNAEHSYINSAKALAWTVVDLLADGAAQAAGLLKDYRPAMTKAEYLSYMRQVSRTEDFDGATVGGFSS
jgi:amidohydrolase